MRARWRQAWPAVVLAAGAIARVAGAASSPECDTLAVSDRYSSDRTTVCYAYRRLTTGAEIKLWTSRDGMRTWRPAAAAGLAAGPQSVPGQMFFADATLFLQISDRGLLMSDDVGETFALADPLGSSSTGQDNLTPAQTATASLVPGGPAPLPAVEIAYGDPLPDRAAMVRPPLHQYVVGSTDADLRFAPYLAADGTRRWISLAERRPGPPTPDPRIASLWDCDATLTCTEKRHEFHGQHGAVDVIAAPGFGTTSQVVFVTTRDRADGANGRLTRLWRSTNGGRSFAEVAPVAAVRRAIAAGGLATGELAVGVVFANSRTVVLRIEYDDAFGAPSVPVRQILVSSDAGTTWRTAAFGRSSLQPGPRGTLTWSGSGGMTLQERGRVQHRAGQLFLIARVGDTPRAWCSRNMGRTWSAAC